MSCVQDKVNPKKVTPAKYTGNNCLLFNGSGNEVELVERTYGYDEVWSVRIQFIPNVSNTVHLLSDTGAGGTTRITSGTYINITNQTRGWDFTTVTGAVINELNEFTLSCDGLGNITATNLADMSSEVRAFSTTDTLTVNSIGGQYGTPTGVSSFSGYMCAVDVEDDKYLCTTGDGDIVYNTTTGYHGLISGCTWGTNDNAPSYNIDDGFTSNPIDSEKIPITETPKAVSDSFNSSFPTIKPPSIEDWSWSATSDARIVDSVGGVTDYATLLLALASLSDGDTVYLADKEHVVGLQVLQNNDIKFVGENKAVYGGSGNTFTSGAIIDGSIRFDPPYSGIGLYKLGFKRSDSNADLILMGNESLAVNGEIKDCVIAGNNANTHNIELRGGPWAVDGIDSYNAGIHSAPFKVIDSTIENVHTDGGESGIIIKGQNGLSNCYDSKFRNLSSRNRKSASYPTVFIQTDPGPNSYVTNIEISNVLSLMDGAPIVTINANGTGSYTTNIKLGNLHGPVGNYGVYPWRLTSSAVIDNILIENLNCRPSLVAIRNDNANPASNVSYKGLINQGSTTDTSGTVTENAEYSFLTDTSENVDARAWPITNLGGYPHNGAESNIQHTDVGILTHIETPWGNAEQGELVNGKPSFSSLELGDELVTNGDFSDGGADWSTTGESTVNTGVGRIYSSAGASSTISTPLTLITGTFYQLDYTVTESISGNIYWFGGGGSGNPLPSTVGTHSVVREADGAINDVLILSRVGTCDISVDNVSVREILSGATIQNDVTQWTATNEATGETFANTTWASSAFPPLDDWAVGSLGTPAITLGYLDCKWVDETDYEFAEVSYAELRAHPNGSGRLYLKCAEINSVPHYEELAQYLLNKEFTATEADKSDKYFGDNCGTGQSSLRDVDGELVTDVDGNVIFTS